MAERFTATAVAASVSITLGSQGPGVAVSIAGANALNTIRDDVTAQIDGSPVNVTGAVMVSATESSSITGTAVSMRQIQMALKYAF